MSAPLGYFSDDSVVDYPELNKCPDCETFFADLHCPICGKECPEEMRAGNRKPVKVKKKRRTGGSGRVQFVPWYLSTWFTVLMLIVQPIIGLILTWAGYWKKHWKILATVLVVLSYTGFSILGGMLGLVGVIQDLFEKPPVNTEMSRSDYIAMCEVIDTEAVYRRPDDFDGQYIRAEVTVKAVLTDLYDYEGKNNLYYHCAVEEADGTQRMFLVRDWQPEDYRINLVAGDRITVYGQVGGNTEVMHEGGTVKAPCIHMRFVALR